MGRHRKRRSACGADMRAGYLEMACRILLRAARPAVDARRAHAGRTVAIRLMAQAGVDLSRLEAPLPVDVEVGDLAARALGTDEAPPMHHETGGASRLCLCGRGHRMELRCGECGHVLLCYTIDATATPSELVSVVRWTREVRDRHILSRHTA